MVRGIMYLLLLTTAFLNVKTAPYVFSIADVGTCDPKVFNFALGVIIFSNVIFGTWVLLWLASIITGNIVICDYKRMDNKEMSTLQL